MKYKEDLADTADIEDRVISWKKGHSISESFAISEIPFREKYIFAISGALRKNTTLQDCVE